MQKKRVILGVTLSPTSAHLSGWRHHDAISNAGATFDDLLKVVKHAEDEKFDFAFIADELGAPEEENNILAKNPIITRFEPLTLISAISVNTNKIGLVATQTTTYNEPYHIARKFASIDNLSNGRVGWNVVTSYLAAEANNFGNVAHPPADYRYERADEFLTVTYGLWNSWDEDAFVLNKKTGQYFLPDKINILNHTGKHFSVRGPLNVIRPVQGRPVIIQAGSSDTGKDFSAKHAELVFTAQTNIDKSIAFSQDLRRRASKYGRDGNSIRIVAGLHPYIASTEEEAINKFEELQSFIDIDVALERLSLMIGFDVTSLDIDKSFPEKIPPTEVYKSRQEMLIAQARQDNLTVRELALRVASAFGHRIIVGTPEKIAEDIIKWVEAGAVDGFVIQSPFLPKGLTDFTELVLPILRDQGYFRSEYNGKTFRENLIN